jgi:hypothetical protein
MELKIRSWLQRSDVVVPSGIELYCFGSSLIVELPRDLDILIVYDKATISVERAIALRQEIRRSLNEMTALPVDVLLLSKSEIEQTGFLKNINAVKVICELVGE